MGAVLCEQIAQLLQFNLGPPVELAPGFAVVACQRSGTHLLREILNSNPHVAIVSEPLSRESVSITWHRFLESLPPNESRPIEVAEAARLFDRYIQLLRRDFQESANMYGGPKQAPTSLGLDVKYNQIKCVNPSFTDLRTRPFLLEHFRDRKFRIVHLVRNNLLHQAISLVISNLRKVWRNHDGSTLQGQYRVSVDDLINYMYWVRDERTEFERLSQDLPVHTCEYERVVDDISDINSDGLFSEYSTALSSLASFLQIPNRFHYNHCCPKVINRPYHEFIENYEEVVLAVKQSEFSQFADSI